MEREKNLWREKFLGLLWVLVVYGVGYFPLNVWNLSRSFYINVSLPFETKIPFVPFAVYGYLVVFASIMTLILLIDSRDMLRRVVATLTIMLLVHYALFALIPVQMTFRPDLVGVPGFTAAMGRLFFTVDHPTNCFPSLHVAWPTAATWLTWRSYPRWRPAFIVMILVTAISVVLVKQHYIADAVAGAIVASAVCWVTFRFLNVSR